MNVDNINFKEEQHIHIAVCIWQRLIIVRDNIYFKTSTVWFGGNIVDEYDTKNNYLGEWTKDQLYKELTDYGNLVLLSDGEAHSLVIMEAFSDSLGWSSVNMQEQT